MGEQQWANYIIFGRTMSYCVTDPFHGQVGQTDQTNGEKMFGIRTGQFPDPQSAECLPIDY